MDLHAQGGPALHQLQPGQPASDLGWSTRVDKCGSPDGGGSLDTSATALAPRPVAPNAPPLATLTDSASAGTGSPGDTPTSLQHQLQGRQPSGRVRQQHKGAALPKASTPAGDASARRSKRKGDKEVPRPAPRRPPNASEGNCKQRLGSACAPALAPLMQHGQPSGATPPGLHWFDGGVGTCSAAVQHGPVLELPGLEDLDDVPGLDDLLSGLAEEDPFMGDPFAPAPTALASPWQAADPFAAAAAPPAPAPHQLGVTTHHQGALPPPPLNPSSLRAASPAPLLVPQPLMDRAASADTRRSMTSLEQLPPHPVLPLPPSIGRKSSGVLAARSGRQVAAAAAGATRPLPPPVGVRRSAQQQRAAQRPDAAGRTPDVAGPQLLTLGSSGMGPGGTLGGGSSREAAGAPPHGEVLPPSQPASPRPPAVQWLSRDTSRTRPVKRAAAAGKPPRPPIAASQQSLSAAAALVARAVAAAPSAPAARELQGGADLRLLQCVFGAHFPERWRW